MNTNRRLKNEKGTILTITLSSKFRNLYATKRHKVQFARSRLSYAAHQHLKHYPKNMFLCPNNEQ